MVGFNTLKNMDWDGRIVVGDTLKVDKDSILLCYTGNPVVEIKNLICLNMEMFMLVKNIVLM